MNKNRQQAATMAPPTFDVPSQTAMPEIDIAPQGDPHNSIALTGAFA